MRFSRVLLITPPVKTDLGPVRPSIGLGYLAQILADNGIAYDILDMLLGYSQTELEKKIDEFKPDLLGMNMFSNKYKIAYDTLMHIKQLNPELKIVVGGPHVSCLREQVLSDCNAIDYAIVLEGEQPLLELCQGIPIENIGNLIYRNKKNDVVKNSVRPFISDLNTLSFPRYAKFEMDKYINEKSLISSRGCPYNCIYCAVKLVSGKKVRLRSPKDIVNEMSYWYEKGYRQFSFQDDNFVSKKDRFFEICDEIKRREMNDLFLRCAGARADKLEYDVLRKMVDIGFKTIAIGVEVGNDRMLKIIKKGEKFSDIDECVKNACELGLDVYLNFLAGVPFETLSDIQDSINFALKYPIFYAEWSNIIPYPGTELYDWLKQENYLLSMPEEYLNINSTVSNEPIFETPELPYRERKKILYRLKLVREKILRRSISKRLRQQKIPWGLRHIISYIVSVDGLNKFLFQNRIRKIADRIRYKLYMFRDSSK